MNKMINKMMKVSMVAVLSLVTVLSMGTVKASAQQKGHWKLSQYGKWFYYYDDGTYAMDTVIDGKYPVAFTGVWDGTTIDSGSSSIAQNNETTQSAQNNVAIQATKDNSNDAISYEEFTKIADDTMLNLVNAHRKENGLNTLEWDPILADMSTEKCQHMIDHNYFGHVYKGITTREVQSVAWRHNSDSENAIADYNYNITKNGAIQIATNMFNRWKASPGHDAAMLNNFIVKFGFGFKFSNGKSDYVSYGIQQFAMKHDGYEDNLILPEGFPTSLKTFN